MNRPPTLKKCQNCKHGFNDMMPILTDPPSSVPVTVCHFIPPTVLVNAADGVVYHRSATMQRGSWCAQHKLSFWKLWSNG